MTAMNTHQLAMLLIMSLGVILLRALPFIYFKGGKAGIPPVLDYLGRMMTAAAIAMLVIYSYVGLCDFAHPDYVRLLKAIPAIAVTFFLQLRFRNPLISICAGTAVYMILVQHFAG